MAAQRTIMRVLMVYQAVGTRPFSFGVDGAGSVWQRSLWPALLGVVIGILAAAAPAAAAPVHPPRPDLAIHALDRACGVAVDSEGNVYVASAGESKVKIFDPAHNELGSVANSNEPCGVAVASDGGLYVSEAGTGNVVKYEPAAYPFSGPPSYGAPVPIDTSGEAKGIAVDPFEDRVYVAKADHAGVYEPNGDQGIDEIQRARVEPSTTGGSFTLTFEGAQAGPIAGQATAPIPFDATHGQVESALEELAAIAPGDVSVSQGPSSSNPRDHLIAFTGAWGGTDLRPLIPDFSALVGGGGFAETRTQGFTGRIGDGILTEATGVAAHTFANGNRYLFLADPAGSAADKIYVFTGDDIRTLKLRRTIEGVDHDGDGGTPDQKFGFGSGGAYLATDQGRCPPTVRACAAGHFFVYDDASEVVDEFEASGEFLTQVSHPEFEDARPTAIAVDRSGGPNDGTLYVTAGSGPGAKALAFGALPLPSRSDLPLLSVEKENACAIAVDSHGNRYLAADASIVVYPPGGNAPLATINAPGRPCDLAVDSLGHVYALDRGTSISGDEQAVYFTPSSFPPVAGATYSGPTIVATAGPPHFSSTQSLVAIGLNPGNDHLFVTQAGQTIELNSAGSGSGVLDSDFALNLNLGSRRDIGACQANGHVFVAGQNAVFMLNSTGTEILARIDGTGSPKGPFGTLTGRARIAVEQSNCHLLLFESPRGVAEEYEASGAFVAEFGAFNTSVVRPVGIAVDNSGGSSDGNAYVAFFEDLSAFGPLTYGVGPAAVTGAATSVGEGEATLNGTVDPESIALEECRFDYASVEEFENEGFTGATSAPCVPSPAGIGSGSDPVAVSAQVSGLDAQERYRFRLVAQNKYGTSEGKAGLFGPPQATTQSAQPLSYAEATLRARVDPSGLASTYRFEYWTGAEAVQSTPGASLSATAGETQVQVPVFGLKEATPYSFRVVAENEAGIALGTELGFRTLVRHPTPPCPNASFRTGRSANLPDCRAYELVTPADTRGATPYATDAGGFSQFNDWLTAPSGDGAGERLSFFIDGTTLPGFQGSGRRDGYRAERSTGEGTHPAAGWQSVLFGPSYRQAGGDQPKQQGVASDQLYSFWVLKPLETFAETLQAGTHLRTPAGFEPIGQGSSGNDPQAVGRFIAAGASHVIFESDQHLEPAAPPSDTTAVYDRPLGGPTQVLSLLPGEATPSADASYVAATPDGAAVAFRVGGAIYLRRGGETVKVVDAPNSFAGLSANGKHVYYSTSVNGGDPGALFVFDADSKTATPIAANSIFVNVPGADPAIEAPQDSPNVYFTSTDALTGGQENEGGEMARAGEDNLYLWDGAAISFIAVLVPQDMVAFAGNNGIDLARWSEAIDAEANGLTGRAQSPTRATPDGEVLLFQSHADLSDYDSDGHAQVYRYDSAESSLLCLSCNPSGAPSTTDAALQSTSGNPSTVSAASLIPNVTTDGQAVFFQSAERLLPEDANSIQDVYEWKAQGRGDCELPAGCLALISSGQGEQPNFLYAMTPDGHDVFFSTLERLVGADVAGSPSIYDARVGGGIPDPPLQEPCQGDACQGQGTPVSALPSPTSTGLGGEGNYTPPKAKRRCPKGKRRVTRRGKVRCVKKRSSKRRSAQRRGHGRQGR